uniref:Major intrinsic protein n=1 Tax=viral metagenome TaxID=1070528 RepID=A0A6C0K235_9ZZZZ
MNALPLIAEFFGTFLLLMSIFATGNALIIGLTLSFNIWLLGGISGSHMNPAVSIAMLVNGAISPMEFIIFTVAQFAGAVSAWYAYKTLV